MFPVFGAVVIILLKSVYVFAFITTVSLPVAVYVVTAGLPDPEAGLASNPKLDHVGTAATVE